MRGDGLSDFVGVIDENQGAWGIRIPDLPGCYGAGDSAEAAIRDALPPRGNGSFISRLRGSLARKRPRRVKSSARSRSMSRLARPPFSFRVLIDEGRTVRANLTFDAGLLGAIDAAASERGLTRSAFLASAARENAAVKS